MSVTTDGDEAGEMTLGFELSAFKQLKHPNEVLSDAQDWSRYVGLIANDNDAVTSYMQDHDLEQDFDLGGRDKWLALAEIRQTADTDRHVFVGLTTDDRQAAEQTGWEFIHVRDAAEKAGWKRAERPGRAAGIFERLRSRLQAVSFWVRKDH